MTSPNSKILIAGAGTFGLSAAYRLARAGYKDITVLEKGTAVPADLSAGNDINKIIRAEYEDPFYADLALEAIKEWKSPLFKPYYHETGYLLATSPTAPEKSKKTLQKSLSSISSNPAFSGKIVPLNSRDDIRAVAPVFDGPMQWVGYFNKYAGYSHAADAMTAVYSACCALDVVFHFGDGVRSLNFKGDKCIGATTESGKTYAADMTVLALGASIGAVLPEVGRQMTAKGFSVGHVQLTQEEAATLRGIPVTYARDIGFFFEPEPRTGLLKLCPATSGYTNFVPSTGVSIPPANNGWIPECDEKIIRKLLRETLPALADRPIINKKMCWCADTADTEYVIDYVPGKENLLVASGDSGHGFKMLPIAGNWIKDVLEAGRQDIKRWRWKEGQDASGEASWRVGKTLDIKDVTSKL